MGMDPSEIMEQFDQYPGELHEAIQQQSVIGWCQMLYGRLSKQWSNANYSHSDNPTDTIEGSWQVAPIKVIWKKWQELWQDRNEALHGYDEASRKRAETLEVPRQLVHNFYPQRTMLESLVQALLLEPEEQHNTQPIQHVTKNWLQVNSIIFKENARRVNQLALRGVRSIGTYFPPRASPPG
ncbi:hypothetical protein MHU86_14057 [Fragilaria crotonensis]|nr:hypothetical protein MHU86_25737 [Fragilaria crotonensis]KAI2500386.1 hypothetical protein MHU86_14057 [Fragilaria crotonensis]